MPIKLTNRDLLDSPTALRKLSDMQIPVRTGLKLRKILKVAQADIETAHEQIVALGKKHAARAKNEDGSVKLNDDGEEVMMHVLVKKGEGGEKDVFDETRYDLGDNQKAYDKDIEDLLDAEVEIAFDPIKVEDLEDPVDPKQPLRKSTLKIETSLLFTLHWLIAD